MGEGSGRMGREWRGHGDGDVIVVWRANTQVREVVAMSDVGRFGRGIGFGYQPQSTTLSSLVRSAHTMVTHRMIRLTKDMAEMVLRQEAKRWVVRVRGVVMR